MYNPTPTMCDLIYCAPCRHQEYAVNCITGRVVCPPMSTLKIVAMLCPQQSDDISCGVFVFLFARDILGDLRKRQLATLPDHAGSCGSGKDRLYPPILFTDEGPEVSSTLNAGDLRVARELWMPACVVASSRAVMEVPAHRKGAEVDLHSPNNASGTLFEPWAFPPNGLLPDSGEVFLTTTGAYTTVGKRYSIMSPACVGVVARVTRGAFLKPVVPGSEGDRAEQLGLYLADPDGSHILMYKQCRSGLPQANVATATTLHPDIGSYTSIKYFGGNCHRACGLPCCNRCRKHRQPQKGIRSDVVPADTEAGPVVPLNARATARNARDRRGIVVVTPPPPLKHTPVHKTHTFILSPFAALYPTHVPQ